jgi:hypothetical protein
MKSLNHITLVILAIVLTGCTPKAPVKATFRPSLMSDVGYVLQVQNTSDKHLSGVLRTWNTVKNQSRELHISIGPYQSAEYGPLEMSWTFKSNERVQLSFEGYNPYNFLVP